VQIRETLAEIRGGDVGEKAKELSTRAKRIEAKAVTVGKPPTISGWFWAAIALLCLGFLLLIIATIECPVAINPQQPWYEYFLGILIIAILFILPGVYCLRRGMAQNHLIKPALGKVSNWWWLLPIILAFAGGIISWTKQKDVDWRKATNLLALGIVLSVFWVIPFLVLQAPVVPSTSPEPPAAAPETPKVEPPELSSKPMYEDDFSNPTSGWATTSTEKEELTYADGEFCISIKTFNHSDWVYSTKPGVLSDFTLEIDARPISGPKDAGYGVVFRFQGDDNFYRFLVFQDGYYLVGTRVNGKWAELQGKTKSDFIKQGNSTNRLKIVCKGPKIEAYVNGYHLTTVTDNSFAEGYVGMIVDTALPNAHIAFDNIRTY
jgi:hypothetical protein